MSTIVTRSGKGSPLTNNEVDSNFTNLNTDKIEKTNLSVSVGAASGGGSLSYSNSTGVFSFSPANLTGYLLTETDTLNSVTGRGNTTTNAITVGDATADSFQLNLSATETSAVGKLRWDSTHGTYALGLIGGNVESTVGQSVHVYVTNAESITINKGQVVYQFGAQGDRPTIKLAVNTSDATSAKTLGIAAENIAAGQTGIVISHGNINGINTSSFAIGDTLYLGASAGSVTNVKPQAPNHMVYVGVVARSNAGSGIIYAKVQNGYELDEIHDVQITSIANNDIIKYNSSAGLWQNINLNTAIGQALTTTSNVQFANITSTGNVQIDGNLTVSGTTVTINTTNLAVEDNMIYLNNGSIVSNPDLGIAGNYNDGVYRHAGIFRDATDGRWKVFDSYTLEPDASAYIDTSHASFNLAAMQASTFYGALSGNATTATSSTTATNLAGGSAGTIPYQSGAGTTVQLAAGTSGYVLKSNGAAAPSWTIGTISGVQLGSNLSTLTLNTSGTGLSGSTTYNGSAAATFTVTSNATSANTASTIVARDASNNFSAGTITAALSGNATTATTATNQSGGTVNGTTGAFSGITQVTNSTASTTSSNGALVVTGGVGVGGRVNVNDIVNRITGNGNSAWLQQDGTGRVHWYWNTYGGLSPVFTNAGEDAGDTMMTVNNAGAGANFQFRTASGVGKLANDPITWTIVLYADLSSFSYKGSTVLHASNYNTYSPTLTGTGASGSWNISVTGNAATATSATTATNLAGGAANRVAYQTGIGTTSFIAAPSTSNTYLKWDGSALVWGNVTGTVSSIDVSGGSTGLTTSGGPITSSGTITLAGTLIAGNGGTGQSSYAVGDLLYASTSTVLSKLADVATGNALISGGLGVAPTYGKIGLTTHVNGTLPIANGGTGVATAPAAMAALMGFTTTVTSVSAVTLTNTSNCYQVFTGSTAQTVNLPVTSTLVTGWTFYICNNSTATMTVRSSGASTVISVPAGITVICTCIGTTLTTAADWKAGYTDFSTITGTGSVVMSDSASLTSATLTTPVYSGSGSGAGGTSGSWTVTGGLIATGAASNINLGNNVTTGTIQIGGVAQTSTMIVGQSTKAHTLSIGSGATETATTKTIQFGGSGVSGSTTAMTFGSSVAGATTTATCYGTWQFPTGISGGTF